MTFTTKGIDVVSPNVFMPGNQIYINDESQPFGTLKSFDISQNGQYVTYTFTVN